MGMLSRRREEKEKLERYTREANGSRPFLLQAEARFKEEFTGWLDSLKAARAAAGLPELTPEILAEVGAPPRLTTHGLVQQHRHELAGYAEGLVNQIILYQTEGSQGFWNAVRDYIMENLTFA